MKNGKFQIYSRKHAGYWKPGALGYTPNRSEAGWFSAGECLKFMISSSFGCVGGAPDMELHDDAGMRFTLEFIGPRHPDAL